MKILIVNFPFSTPVSPSYSIAKLHEILKNYNPEVLDLNAIFHKKKYSDYYKKFNEILKNYNYEDYNALSKEFKKIITVDYSKINKEVISDYRNNTNNSIEINSFIKEILKFKPDIIISSIVYSSQAIIATQISKILKDQNIKLIIGGPGVNEKLKDNAIYLDSYEKLKEILPNIIMEKYITPIYTIFNKEDFLTTKIVIPIKTSESCYYKKCSFCTHHHDEKYFEYDIKDLEQEISIHIKNGFNNFFLVDDAIPKKRLEQISDIFNKYNVTWMCQLRAQLDFDNALLKKLYDSGLRVILWGIESGNDRILKMMRKGTTVKTNEHILKISKENNIKNVTFIMFGFPTETKEEFIDSIEFLKRNTYNIDLVSTSIFGLQRNSPVYREPEFFNIEKIIETKRTLLDDTIEYKNISGMSQEDANLMRKKYKRSIEKINKCPKEMNFFREHMLLIK